MPATLARNMSTDNRFRSSLLPLGSPTMPGGAADQGDGPMPGMLEAAQGHQRQEVPDVQAVGRRVETGYSVRDPSLSHRARCGSSVT